jgi:hypothetical protein
MAQETQRSAAAEACTYLERSGETIPRLRGGPNEIRRQAAALRIWAETQHRIIDYCSPDAAPSSSGAEHQVFFHPKDGRVFKRTYPGTFGSFPTEMGLRRVATPYFYLWRIQLINDVFDDDIRFEGITPGQTYSAIISQPLHQAADPENPLPTLEVITSFMRSLGFEAMPGKQFEWFRPSDGVRVFDARPDNYVLTSEGAMPIDLVVMQDGDRTVGE